MLNERQRGKLEWENWRKYSELRGQLDLDGDHYIDYYFPGYRFNKGPKWEEHRRDKMLIGMS